MNQQRQEMIRLLPRRAVNPVVIPDRGYARAIALDSPVPLSLDGIRWVEAWMRLEHSTLDGLSPARFKSEVVTALHCIVASTEQENEGLARSYGL